MNMMQTTSRMSLGQALALEDQLTATCGRVTSKGFEEGLIADLNHPLTGGRNVIFTGGRFVPFNHSSSGRPLYKPCGPGVAFVRRGDVEFIERIGNTPLAVFSKPSGEVGLVLVNMSYAPPKGVIKLNRGFWSGVHYGPATKYQVIERDGAEALIQFVGEIGVFYADGSIVKVGYSREEGLKCYQLTLEQQAHLRVDHAQSVIADSKKKSTVQVRQGYELMMQILAVGGRRWQSIKDRIVSVFREQFAEVPATTRLELITLIGHHWPEEVKIFEALLAPSKVEVVEQTAEPVVARIPSSPRPERPRFVTCTSFSGLPDAMAQKELARIAAERKEADDQAAKDRADREKKRAARRAANADRAERTKGSTAEVPLHPQKSKGKAGAKSKTITARGKAKKV